MNYTAYAVDLVIKPSDPSDLDRVLRDGAPDPRHAELQRRRPWTVAGAVESPGTNPADRRLPQRNRGRHRGADLRRLDDERGQPDRLGVRHRARRIRVRASRHRLARRAQRNDAARGRAPERARHDLPRLSGRGPCLVAVVRHAGRLRPAGQPHRVHRYLELLEDRLGGRSGAGAARGRVGVYRPAAVGALGARRARAAARAHARADRAGRRRTARSTRPARRRRSALRPRPATCSSCSSPRARRTPTFTVPPNFALVDGSPDGSRTIATYCAASALTPNPRVQHVGGADRGHRHRLRERVVRAGRALDRGDRQLRRQQFRAGHADGRRRRARVHGDERRDHREGGGRTGRLHRSSGERRQHRLDVLRARLRRARTRARAAAAGADLALCRDRQLRAGRLDPAQTQLRAADTPAPLPTRCRPADRRPGRRRSRSRAAPTASSGPRHFGRTAGVALEPRPDEHDRSAALSRLGRDDRAPVERRRRGRAGGATPASTAAATTTATRSTSRPPRTRSCAARASSSATRPASRRCASRRARARPAARITT